MASNGPQGRILPEPSESALFLILSAGDRERATVALVGSEDPAFAGGSYVFTQRYVRHSFPDGTTSECGLFFIAYTKDLSIPEKMLRRMLGAARDGRHDRLMGFMRAVSGATFFAPSLRLLRSLGAA